jgi:two-component system, cell cycle sensor histidine kinase and response regulator CckA
MTFGTGQLLQASPRRRARTETSSLRRGLIVLVTAMLLAVAVGGVWVYRNEKQTAARHAFENLSSIAHLKADQIATWRRDRLAAGLQFSESPCLADGVVGYLATPHAQPEATLLAQLRAMQRERNYSDVLLVDTTGSVRLSVYRSVHSFGINEGAIARAMREKRPAITDLHADNYFRAVHISVVTPIFAGADSHASPIALIVLVSDASQSLFPLIQSWPTPSATAEALLVGREGSSALYLSNRRHQPVTAAHLAYPLTRTEIPAVKAVLGHTGIFRGTDDRGAEVVSFLLPVQDSPWFLVTKVDAAEIFADWRSRAAMIVSVLAALFISVFALGLTAWQRGTKRHYRALYESEAALRASIERHSITLKSIGDAVIATDAGGQVELLNPVAEALTGWTNEEARGKPLADVFHVIHHDTRATLDNPVAKVLRERGVVELADHSLLVARDGRERPVANSGAPIRNEHGDITGVVLVFRDQSNDDVREQALRESEEKFRALFESSADAILLLDNDTIVDCNQAAVTMFQASGKAEMRARPAPTLSPETQPSGRYSRHERNRHWAQSGETGHAFFEWTFLRFGTQEPFPTEVTLTSTIVCDHLIRQAAIRDTTERQRLREQFLHAQKMESVGRLAGGVAHDFNNMLAAILGYTDLALSKVEPDSAVYSDLIEIQAAAERSADLTKQLLAFSRQQVIAPQVIDLNETVEGLIKMLRRLIGEHVTLVWTPGTNLWPVHIDPAQITQILTNLCVNARDAIADVGRVVIRTERVVADAAWGLEHPGVPGAEFVRLSVADTGSGMEKAVLDRMFEPFFTTKGPAEGTGLGLATVYGIVQQNNGHIRVKSDVGVGTLFQVYLPRYVGVADDTAAPAPEGPSGCGHETVLLVEDEPAMLAIARSALTRLGYDVLAAGSPGEALRLATSSAGPIHVLLTDVIMPEMNGRDLATRLLALRPDMACVFMSGYTADVIAARGVLDEGVAFVQKPFTMSDLGLTIRNTLARQHGAH